MRLRTRVLLTHLSVAAAAIVVVYALVRLLAPRIFDTTTGLGAGRGSGWGPVLRAALASAVDQALGWGLLGAAVVAIALAWWMSGRVIRSLTQLRHVTGRLTAGDYSVRATLSPEPEIRDLDRGVNVLAERLATTEAQRTRLVGDVAHEIRTPLTVIEGYVEGMIDGVFPVSAERLEAINDEVAKIRRLAEDFATLSTMDEVGMRLEFAPVRMDHLVVEVTERLDPQFHAAGLRLSVDVAPCVIEGDRMRLAQVLTNLLGNALRATPEGGQVEVRLEVVPTARTCQLTVTDSGRGLAPDQVERIFERFTQVPGGRGGGSGIGLTLARDIVARHDGTLVATSPGPGCGATFTVTVPGNPPAG